MNRHSKSKEFFLQVSFDYLSQLEAVIEAKRIGRSAVAKILGVSKGRVSQIFNRPSNLKLEKIVEYARRLNRKVAIVLYDDGDGRNKKGPILPQIYANQHSVSRRHGVANLTEKRRGLFSREIADVRPQPQD